MPGADPFGFASGLILVETDLIWLGDAPQSVGFDLVWVEFEHFQRAVELASICFIVICNESAVRGSGNGLGLREPVCALF